MYKRFTNTISCLVMYMLTIRLLKFVTKQHQIIYFSVVQYKIKNWYAGIDSFFTQLCTYLKFGAVYSFLYGNNLLITFC